MQTKRTVLFFHHSSAIGGAGISGLNAINAIPKDKYQVIVYCYSHNGPMNKVFREAGYDVIDGGASPVPFAHCMGDESFFFSPRTLRNLYRVIQDKKIITQVIREASPDIVMVNSVTLFWIGRIAKKQNRKTVCFLRETYTKGLLGIRTWYMKRQLSLYMDSVAFISQYDMTESKDLRCKKYLIYNTVNESEFGTYDRAKVKEQLGLENNQTYILFVGGLSRLKGAYVIIRAMRHIKHSIKLVIVGYRWNGVPKKLSDCKTISQKAKYLFRIDYEAKCIRYILKNHLADKIVFFPPRTDIALFYSACNILVFPATRPHQARPLIEAGYARIPAIVSDFPNYNEFKEQACFYTFKVNDYRKLAKVVESVLASEGSVDDVTETNYISTAKRHNKATYVWKIRALMEELV